MQSVAAQLLIMIDINKLHIYVSSGHDNSNMYIYNKHKRLNYNDINIYIYLIKCVNIPQVLLH